MARRRFVAVPTAATVAWVDPMQVALVRTTRSITEVVMTSGFVLESSLPAEALLDVLEIAHGEAEFHFDQRVNPE